MAEEAAAHWTSQQSDVSPASGRSRGGQLPPPPTSGALDGARRVSALSFEPQAPLSWGEGAVLATADCAKYLVHELLLQSVRLLEGSSATVLSFVHSRRYYSQRRRRMVPSSGGGVGRSGSGLERQLSGSSAAPAEGSVYVSESGALGLVEGGWREWRVLLPLRVLFALWWTCVTVIFLWLPFGQRMSDTREQYEGELGAGIRRSPSTTFRPAYFGDGENNRADEASGLLEDVQDALDNRIDSATRGLRRRMRGEGTGGVGRGGAGAAGGGGLPVRASDAAASRPLLPRSPSVERRHIADETLLDVGHVMRSMGYPFERVSVVTDDGYVLAMDRIPNNHARGAVFFQHGLLDSSFSWVANPFGSAAIRFFEAGYDVWLGNFRGSGEREHVSSSEANPPYAVDDDADQANSRKFDGDREQRAAYWDFSVDEHAHSDIPASLRKIHALKGAELRREYGVEAGQEGIEVSIVAHSMGAMATLMHLVSSGVDGRDALASHAVLVCPAGLHRATPWLYRWLFIPLCGRMHWFANSTALSDWSVKLMVKLGTDLRSLPATRDLLATVMKGFVGGDVSTTPVVHNDWFFSKLFHTGCSTKVLRHFAQLSSSGQFRGFEPSCSSFFSPSSPSPRPPATDYLERCGAVAIPLDVVVCERDGLCIPSDVRAQCDALRAAGVTVRLTSMGGLGHVDMVYGIDCADSANVLVGLVAEPPKVAA